MKPELKVAIVGCGKIAHTHASQILSLAGREVVGVCNQSLQKAKEFSERFHIKGTFSCLADLLEQSQPDVVHITTPPESHFDLAISCIEHSCHVYIEKPFTVNTGQARRLIEAAEQRRAKLTVGHNNQFSPVARRMRELIRLGYLGGPPVHMESYYCYDVADPKYARAFLTDKRHWVRRLPGKLLQNVISHGVARIAEFLTGDQITVLAHGFASPYMKGTGEQEIIDELRVIVSDNERRTAYFTFSSQMRPLLHQFRVYGPKNGLVLDEAQATLMKLRGQKFRSYAENLIPPVLFSTQHVGNFARNCGLLLSGGLQPNSGMRSLIDAFHRSIREDLPVPISYKEILRTSSIMDAIIEQVNSRERQTESLSCAED
jgi:predicted dehydrogenase